MIGSTQDWSGKFMFPSVGNVSGFPAAWRGVVWEWHTASMSGNHIAIDPDGRLRIGAYNPVDQWYRYGYDPAGQVQTDHWYSWRIQLKWSHGSDGFLKGWLDGNLIADFTGATLKAGESQYLQFGFYSGPGSARNEVIHAALRKA